MPIDKELSKLYINIRQFIFIFHLLLYFQQACVKKNNMIDSPFLRPLCIIAAFLGTVQGLTWMILSILVILLDSEIWIPNIDSMNYFNTAAYNLLFQNTSNPVVDDLTYLICNFALFAFAWIYVILSFLWTVISLILAQKCYRNHYNNVTLDNYGNWVVITFLVTTFDLILSGLLIIDFVVIQYFSELDDATKFLYNTIVGVVMTITARGYILVIINIAVTISLIRVGGKFKVSVLECWKQKIPRK
ncbi:uncharacterized protein [Onthophagus taurus]|uniref:uncharacterized protein n=1 Tax=Onthophagus taurus TaxID=166361 RepID=UPI0039BDFCDB